MSPIKEEKISIPLKPNKEISNIQSSSSTTNQTTENGGTSNDSANNNAIIFSLKNQVTGLVRALRIFQVSNNQY